MDIDRIAIDRMKVARPHLGRAALYGLIALAGLVAASSKRLRVDEQMPWDGGLTPREIVAMVGVGVLLVFGIAAVRALARAAHIAATEGLDHARMAPISFIITITGYIIVLLAVLGSLGYNASGLLLGGAFTGIVVGIAAQQTLGNLIAGIVLVIVRPFRVGDEVVLKGGPIGGEYDGTVTEMSAFYVHLETKRGPVALPNAGVLACAVGPGARSEDPEEEEEPEKKDADPGPAHGSPA